MNNHISFDPMVWAAATINNNEAANTRNDQPQQDGQVTNINAVATDAATELAKAEAVGDELERLGANIAESYDDYLQLGFALADGLGSEGRELYHRLCRASTKYREADCERKWQECLRRHDGRTTIASYYKMAQTAGVDLSAIGRRFSSFPPFPPLRQVSSDGVAGLEYHGKSISQVFDSNGVNSTQPSSFSSHGTGTDSGGGLAEMAETSLSEALDGSMLTDQTFSDKLDLESLPELLKGPARTQDTAEGRDKVILGALDLYGGFMPNVRGVYDKRRVYPPFYAFFVAPSGADKGMMPACKALVDPIVSEIRSQNDSERRDYRTQKARYEALGKKEKANAEEPVEPPYRTPLIAVNASATAFYQDLAANGGWGAVFETEADSLTQTIKQNYGDYSSGLRKIFHHESIEYSRRKDNEHVYMAEPRLSALFTCTPGQLPPLLSPQHVENGLANRFVFYLLEGGHHWRNVFEECEQTLYDQMAVYGQRYLELFHDLLSFSGHPLTFTLNEEQKQRFNEFFEPLYHEQIGLYGDDLDGFVKRLALVTYRIAMTLTVLRHDEQKPRFSEQDEPLVCCENDYQTAITIANCLINHTVYVYNRLLPHEKAPIANNGRVMSAQEQAFLQALPTEFCTTDFIAIARQMRIADRTSERYIGHFINDFGVVVRIAQGHYRKR